MIKCKVRGTPEPLANVSPLWLSGWTLGVVESFLWPSDSKHTHHTYRPAARGGTSTSRGSMLPLPRRHCYFCSICESDAAASQSDTGTSMAPALQTAATPQQALNDAAPPYQRTFESLPWPNKALAQGLLGFWQQAGSH